MSDAQSKQSNQKLIKIKPFEQLRKVQNQEPVHFEMDKEVIQQRIHALQQELTDLTNTKQTLIEQTNQTIMQEKKNWETEKEQWIEQAKKDGFTAGFQQGKREGQAEYEEKLLQANQIIESTTKDYHATIEKSDEAILQLAVSVASKILNSNISDDASSFMGVVRGAIKEIKDQSVITIKLHPANYELVMQHKEELHRSLESDTKLSVYIDQNLSENACLIEHPFGQIDASIDTQLSKIREALHDYLMENKS
ncbi:flagellar assembly protein FliH [Oceanobacillus saliphilus]|uniref:flagellar assembly protein FliH n=1 Tax=Oceanobacillus saliphilus TaxID=2925834 RepID=UPI00201E270F|nr:flagellar assembly protein FliH [Oceanobacillus saliphilus]